MKLIFKYLKPFALLVLVCIVLLFVQNIADLQLPNFMSRIVNNGLIRSGITEDTPRVVSERAMIFITEFCGGGDAEAFKNAYTLSAPGSELSRENEKEFPALKEESAYILTETDKAALARAEEAFGNAMVAFDYYIFSINPMPENADPGTYSEEMSSFISGLDAWSMYEMQGGFDADRVNTAIQISAGTEALYRKQVGVSYIQKFYAEQGADLAKIQRSTIMATGITMLLFTLLVIAATVTIGFLSSKISTGIGRKMRHDMFKKVESFLPAEFDEFSTATLITRSTNDVQQVQQLAMMGIRMICSAPIMGIGGIIMAVNKSNSMSWIIIVAVILLTGLQVMMFTIITPRFRIMQKLLDKLNLVARESLSGMLVIRAFGNESREEERFAAANSDIRDTNQFVQRVMAIMNPTMNLIMSCTNLVIIWLGSHAIGASRLQIGDMMAFMQYVMQIIMSFQMVAMMFIMVPRAMVSAKRISEVLDKEPSIKDKPTVKTLGGRSKGEVEFKNVSFKYNDAESRVLSDISFSVKPGQTVAFIGSTGSGKSTLINLLPRFYDVTEGSIELDGVDIRDLSQNELRSNIGYVPQKGILFSGDIESNMLYGKENATEDEMRTAIQVAQAEDFVFSQVNGLYSEIAQGGDNVSGGQKQRLSIARALIKKPPIYIFDDSFSALDFRTDAALRKALRNFTGGATVFLVAQRVSTLMNADLIIVLDEGRIVGKGTHKELLENCVEYKEIAESQLSKEELVI